MLGSCNTQPPNPPSPAHGYEGHPALQGPCRERLGARPHPKPLHLQEEWLLLAAWKHLLMLARQSLVDPEGQNPPLRACCRC